MASGMMKEGVCRPTGRIGGHAAPVTCKAVAALGSRTSAPPHPFPQLPFIPSLPFPLPFSSIPPSVPSSPFLFILSLLFPVPSLPSPPLLFPPYPYPFHPSLPVPPFPVPTGPALPSPYRIQRTDNSIRVITSTGTNWPENKMDNRKSNM